MKTETASHQELTAAAQKLLDQYIAGHARSCVSYDLNGDYWALGVTVSDGEKGYAAYSEVDESHINDLPTLTERYLPALVCAVAEALREGYEAD